MKTILCIFALSSCLTRHIAFSHEIVVHENITKHVETSAFVYSSAYSGFLGGVASDCDREAAVESIVKGSNFEDNVDEDEGGKRPANDFYDRFGALGLSNIPPDDRVAPLGRNSFVWASIFNSLGVNIGGPDCLANMNKYNSWSWQNARDYEWHGLTDANPANRHTALTNTFRAIGQVMHLLQDASQPQHTRNEQHLNQWPCVNLPAPWQSPIEAYGAMNVAVLNYQHAMLDWRAQASQN